MLHVGAPCKHFKRLVLSAEVVGCAALTAIAQPMNTSAEKRIGPDLLKINAIIP